MVRYVSFFLLGLLCGAAIVGALMMQESVSPVRAAGNWQAEIISNPVGTVPNGDDEVKFVSSLSADCEIETATYDTGETIVFYRCP